MKRNFLLLLIASYICHATNAVPQKIFNNSDDKLLTEIRSGMDHLYNWRFAEAEKVLVLVKRLRPGNPGSDVFEGILYYWKNYPLVPEKPESQKFITSLERAIATTDKLTAAHGSDPEWEFFNLISRSLLMQYYSETGQSSKAISHAVPTYRLTINGFKYQEEFKEFYFISGLYNYYREAYPQANPIYKPVVAFLHKGDKVLGIKQLKYASDFSVFTKAESLSFLSWIYLNYENDFKTYLSYSKRLYLAFPGNALYLSYYIKALLLNKQYNEAKLLNKGLMEKHSSLPFFKMESEIYAGVIEEKLMKNNKLAELHYNRGIALSNQFGIFGQRTVAYAYYGLSRIYESKNDMKKSKEYRKKANSMTAYSSVTFD